MEGDSIKQRKVASVIQQALSEIFLKENIFTTQGGMVSISQVNVSPDLVQAKVYLSLFQVANAKKFMEEMELASPEMRHQLGNRIRNQVRRIPELSFHIDDSLDQVFKLEEIFKKIKK